MAEPMDPLEFSLDGRSSLYTINPSKTIPLDNTDWAPHEVLGSWILEHCRLEDLQREATLEDKDDISARLKACEEQIDTAIEKLTISGPIFTPPDNYQNQFLSGQSLGQSVSERFCPNLCYAEPKSPKYPARLQQTSSKASELLKELQSPALEYDATDTSSSATFHDFDSFSSNQGDGAFVKDSEAVLLSASRLDLKNFVRVCDIPDFDDNRLMKWAESSGVFSDIAQMPNHTADFEAARKQKLHDAAMASRDASRVWWVNINNSPVPEFDMPSVEKLGTVEVEYRLSSTPPGLQVYFDESPAEESEKIWRRRGVNPPNPIKTDIRKPGTLCTLKANSDGDLAPPTRRVTDTTKAGKHGNAITKLAMKMRQFTSKS